jgi:hypothetical protein
MSTTSTYVPPIKAPATPAISASDRDANKSEDSGSGFAPVRYQCCVCELYDWVFPGFGADETCFRCNHAACDWCIVYTRVTEVIMGA